MKSSFWLQGSFTAHFKNVLQRFGNDAADVRHELFYLAAGRTPLAAGWRACGALFRDIRLLWSTDAAGLAAAKEPQAVLLATLSGASGWGTLQRSLAVLAAAGYRPVVLAHPRLSAQTFAAGLDVIRPAPTSIAELWASFAVLLVNLLRLRSLLVASCLARRRLWRGSLQRTLAASRGVLLLHNDFDLMSRAAIGQGLPAICLQHGVPTDEFFPTRADWYLIWGRSSREAFTASGSCSSRLVEDALGRDKLLPAELRAPEGLALLSQTHAQVLGERIDSVLQSFADSLLQWVPQAQILLHPQERPLYKGPAARAIRRPPHPHLQPGVASACLVVGYCSTAMLDAALAGNWVVALQLPLPGNQAARTVLAAPLQAQTAQQVAMLYARLRDDVDFRRQAAQAQMQWLRASFSSQPGGLAALLQTLGQPSSVEPVQ